MFEGTVNNKRIAKNTLLLYVRTLFIMLVTLYTSRVVLNTLGVSDYGIYNVVGGVVAMFGFINASMSSATQRYITFALGKGDIADLRKIFSTALQIHVLIAALIVVLGETVGLWFMYTQMQIPADRMNAAFWVLQCSIVSSVVMIISVPYNADIIAHERMSAFAYISIIEAVLRLAIVYLLLAFSYDKLILYAFLTLAVQLLIRFCYSSYCNKHFPESKYRHVWDKFLFKEMTGFAGWGMFSSLSGILSGQGLNMLLNVFFGPVVNSARAVAVQVQNAILQFIGNFQMAINPQITKSYATGELSYMYSLVCRSAKFSSFLLTFFAVPIILEAPFIFSIWLDNVPEYAVIFFRLSVLVAYVDGALANSLMTSVFATGNIKAYQITVSCLGILVFPISWLFYHCLLPVWTTYLVYFAVYCMVLGARLYMVRKAIGMTIKTYIKSVLYKVIPISLLAFLMPSFLLQIMEEGFLRLCCVVILSMISTAGLIMLWGLTKGERTFLTDKIRGMFNKFN